MLYEKISAIQMKLITISFLFSIQISAESCKRKHEITSPEITPDKHEFVADKNELIADKHEVAEKLPLISKNGLDTFEHVVVLMLENRSFDNFLGYLYEDGVPNGKQFAGLQNRPCQCTIPSRAENNAGCTYVETHAAKDYHQPFPVPGEEFSHVNTQLYNNIDPNNIGVRESKMKPPYNLPPHTPPTTPPMTGFVNDYINKLQTFKHSKYSHPTYEQYSVIMQCFKPQQVNVLATLAKEFAVFDHWFCSVPSQTWCNRAFWHAATSGGHVINPGITKTFSWIRGVWKKKNLFNLLDENKISYSLYIDGPVAFTHLVNGPSFKLAKSYNTSFKKDIEQGLLPQYAFIEPKFFGQHNDQHPSGLKTAGRFVVDGRTREGTVLLGEHLIWEVYTAIKNSDRYRDNTLLIITYDEHGGCFDHVPPPAAVPPKKGMKGEKGFKFDRLGLRVPMVMVSSHIAKNTIVNDVFDHTSFIKTICKKWHLEGLTDRDKNANSFEGVFSDQKRTAWPDIPEPEIRAAGSNSDYHDDPLNDLQKSIVSCAHCIANHNKKSRKTLNAKKNIKKTTRIKTVGKAIKYFNNESITIKLNCALLSKKMRPFDHKGPVARTPKSPK